MLRDELANWPEDEETRTITYLIYKERPDGSYKCIEKTEELTKDDVQKLVIRMDAQFIDLSDASRESHKTLKDLTTKQAEPSSIIGSGRITVDSVASASTTLWGSEIPSDDELRDDGSGEVGEEGM